MRSGLAAARAKGKRLGRPRVAVGASLEGGLIAYGPSLLAEVQRVVVYVSKILKGANPADLPVEQPTQFG